MTIMKKYKLLWILALCAGGVILLDVITQVFIKPQRAPVAQNPSIPSVGNRPYTLKSFRFTGTAPEIPKQLDVFQAKTRGFSTLSTANQYAQALGMQTGISQNTWEDPETRTTLSINKVTNAIAYRKNSDVSPTEKTLSYDQALAQANVFLQTLSLTQVAPVKSEVHYLSGSAEPEETTPAAASTLVLPLTTTLNTYPLFLDNTSTKTVIIWVHATSGILKADLFPTPPLEKLAPSSTISVSQALQELTKGNGVLLSARTTSGKPFTYEDLESAEFSTLTIEYRFSSSTQQAIPYFHFAGTGKTRSGDTVNLDMSTPAVPTASP